MPPSVVPYPSKKAQYCLQCIDCGVMLAVGAVTVPSKFAEGLRYTDGEEDKNKQDSGWIDFRLKYPGRLELVEHAGNRPLTNREFLSNRFTKEERYFDHNSVPNYYDRTPTHVPRGVTEVEGRTFALPKGIQPERRPYCRFYCLFCADNLTKQLKGPELYWEKPPCGHPEDSFDQQKYQWCYLSYDKCLFLDLRGNPWRYTDDQWEEMPRSALTELEDNQQT